MSEQDPKKNNRVAIVLSGGGARGAYEAGVLAYLFEKIYPQLPPGFEFDIFSGTSVGAIHAAYTAASSDQNGPERAASLTRIWENMTLGNVLELRTSDLFSIPLRLLGANILSRKAKGTEQVDTIGGLVDVAPLEELVDTQIPWDGLRANLDERRNSALCVACAGVETGEITVFVDGKLADTTPWDYDPYVGARRTDITARHVRASAAIPFLFPAVRIGNTFFYDGGLRLNTPLSPALRLGANKILVVSLKHTPMTGDLMREPREELVTQPAFMIGKILDVLLLDPIEYELQRMDLINGLLQVGTDCYGPEFMPTINEMVRKKRGTGFQPVETVVVKPSTDLGKLAAQAYSRTKTTRRRRDFLASWLIKATTVGVPHDEADLLSYLFFESEYTSELIELGRRDTADQEADILAMLTS